MSRTSTKIISFETLHNRNGTGPIVLKLMMACNDLQRSNEAFAHSKDVKNSRKAGLGMYFMRLQLGHLYEAFKILEEINKDAELMKLVEQCDNQTQRSFKFLQKYLPGNSKRSDLEKLIGIIRNDLTFHYNESNKLIKKAIKNRVSGIGSKTSSLTRGSTAYLWHFEVADDLMDSIVCRQIWKIPPNKNLREEADKISDEIFQLFLKFMDFSGEFIWKYFS